MPTRLMNGLCVRTTAALLLIHLISVTSLGQGLPCRYTVTVLPEVDCGVFSGPGNPAAINTLGHVLLWAPGCGDPGHSNTFLWTGGDTLQIIPKPAWMLGFIGTDLNDVGQVCGTAVTTFAGQRGYVYNLKTGEWTELPPLNPPTGWSGASAITNEGRVCGFRSIGSKGDPINPTTAFIWTPNSASFGGNFFDLGLLDGRSTRCEDMNNYGLASAATGFAIDPGVLAYLWDGERLEGIGPIPGGLSSGAGRVNDHGWMTTAGILQTNPLVIRAFLRLPRGAFIELPPLPTGQSAGLTSLTNAGVVMGQTNTSTGVPIATVWRNASPLDLEDLTVAFEGDLFSGSMNHREEIVAIGQDERGNDRMLLLTPEYARPGDATCDGDVGIDDLLGVIMLWGQCAGCNGDLTRDGEVNGFDLVDVILNWGKGGAA